MRIIKIKQNMNNSHDNQDIFNDCFIIPDGYALIPENLETPNFPFGDVEVEEIDGIMTVTSWIPRDIPEQEEKETPVSKYDQLRADIDFIAVMTGVTL